MTRKRSAALRQSTDENYVTADDKTLEDTKVYESSSDEDSLVAEDEMSEEEKPVTKPKALRGRPPTRGRGGKTATSARQTKRDVEKKLTDKKAKKVEKTEKPEKSLSPVKKGTKKDVRKITDGKNETLEKSAYESVRVPLKIAQILKMKKWVAPEEPKMLNEERKFASAVPQSRTLENLSPEELAQLVSVPPPPPPQLPFHPPNEQNHDQILSQFEKERKQPVRLLSSTMSKDNRRGGMSWTLKRRFPQETQRKKVTYQQKQNQVCKQCLERKTYSLIGELHVELFCFQKMNRIVDAKLARASLFQGQQQHNTMYQPFPLQPLAPVYQPQLYATAPVPATATMSAQPLPLLTYPFQQHPLQSYAPQQFFQQPYATQQFLQQPSAFPQNAQPSYPPPPNSYGNR